MDELDQLQEMPTTEVRRSVNTITFEFPVGRRQGDEDLREGLVDALRTDGELLDLAAGGHPKMLGVAVDPPVQRPDSVLYRVHVDFEPGGVDYELVRDIIKGNVDAELLAAGE